MTDERSTSYLFFRALVLALLTLISGCRDATSQKEVMLPAAKADFFIFWPPQDASENTGSSVPPLLQGEVWVTGETDAEGSSVLRIRMHLIRPSGEAERQFWNSQLSYADLDWMNEVRVWDKDNLWIWPNLPFLLRRPGKERVDRYGGMDPGKHVDNDFAAVLIRKFDPDGKVESPDTRDSPLVSAEWRPIDADDTDVQTIVHQAASDTFSIGFGESLNAESGRLKIWLIYADFLGARPPRSWPDEPEWAGGVLSYCEVDWQKPRGQPPRSRIRLMNPPTSTGFVWELWGSERATVPARARLSDRPDPIE